MSVYLEKKERNISYKNKTSNTTSYVYYMYSLVYKKETLKEINKIKIIIVLHAH